MSLNNGVRPKNKVRTHVILIRIKHELGASIQVDIIQLNVIENQLIVQVIAGSVSGWKIRQVINVV